MEQLSFPGFGSPPSPAVVEGSSCLRLKPPLQWTHKGQWEHNRVVAVLCGCSTCLSKLNAKGHGVRYAKKK